jgi:folate-binding protein YgfZ
MSHAPFFTKLPGRGLIRVTGADRKSFLQGLITNDVQMLETQPCLYACLLTPQGRYVHDFFITEDSTSECLLLECEGGERAEDLARRLGLYKLRASVALEIVLDIDVYAIIGQTADDSWPDPRRDDMGARSFTKPDHIPGQPFEHWDRYRILRNVPDGSRDMIAEKSMLLEYGIDTLGGISYDKGCYMGQELTARMHYRDLVKRHIQPLRFDAPPPPAGTPLMSQGSKIGEMRSSCVDVGLALLRGDAPEALEGMMRIGVDEYSKLNY